MPSDGSSPEPEFSELVSGWAAEVMLVARSRGRYDPASIAAAAGDPHLAIPLAAIAIREGTAGAALQQHERQGLKAFTQSPRVAAPRNWLAIRAAGASTHLEE